MIFKDFIGNEITEGCHIAYPGGGNAKAEYGMILYKVTGFDLVKSKIKVVRIHAEYAQGPLYDSFPTAFTKNAIFSTHMIKDHYNRNEGKDIESKVCVRFQNSTIENFNKIVIVDPQSRIKSIFEKVLALDSSVFEDISFDEISQWILGSIHTINPFRT